MTLPTRIWALAVRRLESQDVFLSHGVFIYKMETTRPPLKVIWKLREEVGKAGGP